MGRTLYYLKLNINKDIYDCYDKGDSEIEKYLDYIFNTLNSNKDYIMRNEAHVKNDDEEIIHTEITEYFMYAFRVDIGRKVIVGDFHKENILYYDVMRDRQTAKIEKESAKAVATIRFYFDVKKEIIVFYTSQRFGQKQFLKNFEKFINEVISLDKKDSDKKNYVILRYIRNNFSLDEFYKSLRSKSNIKEITFDFIPPNASEKYLNGLGKTALDKLNNYKTTNITSSKEIIMSEDGFNMDTEAMFLKFKEYDEINNILQCEQKEASVDYSSIDAKDKDGKVYSTKDSNYKTIIDDTETNQNSFKEKSEQVVDEVYRKLNKELK